MGFAKGSNGTAQKACAILVDGGFSQARPIAKDANPAGPRSSLSRCSHDHFELELVSVLGLLGGGEFGGAEPKFFLCVAETVPPPLLGGVEFEAFEP